MVSKCFRMMLRLYMVIMGDVQAHIISSIVSLVIWLLVMDFCIKCLQRVIVKLSKPLCK